VTAEDTISVAQATDALLLRPTDVARLLQLGRETTYALIRSGDIPAVRIGRQWRVIRTALARWAGDASP
jgi:excisionase family DNA binding protein